MSKRDKKVSDKALVRKESKAPRVIDHPTDNRPVWRFSTVDRTGPFAWPKGQPDELSIVLKLHDFDSMAWQAIVGSDHHYLSPDSLSTRAKQRLAEINKDDEIENLFSFHLAGKPRIIAIKHGSVAKLLWFDPNHQVCPSTKRNN